MDEERAPLSSLITSTSLAPSSTALQSLASLTTSFPRSRIDHPARPPSLLPPLLAVLLRAAARPHLRGDVAAVLASRRQQMTSGAVE